MPTPAERKALMFIAAVALLGSGVRTVQTLSGAPPVAATTKASLATQIAAVEKAKVRATAPKVGSKGAPTTLDVDRATVDELQTLPGVGPVLAQRIKAFRDSAGPIGSLKRLDSVKGIGPSMLSKLSDKVTFSHTRSH